MSSDDLQKNENLQNKENDLAQQLRAREQELARQAREEFARKQRAQDRHQEIQQSKMKGRLSKAVENSRLNREESTPSARVEEREDLRKVLMGGEEADEQGKEQPREQPKEEAPQRFHLYARPQDLAWLTELEASLNEGVSRRLRTNRSELIRAALHLLRKLPAEDVRHLLNELD